MRRQTSADQGLHGFYSLIGNSYGGDGKKDFALPDLRGAVPIHFHRRSDDDVIGKVVSVDGPSVPTVAVTYAIAGQGIYPEL